MWTRGRRDLATPQGSNLMSALFLCFPLAIVAMVLEGIFHLPGSIVYPIAIIGGSAVIILAVFRVAAINKREAEARREAYRQKFEGNLEEIKRKLRQTPGRRQ